MSQKQPNIMPEGLVRPEPPPAPPPKQDVTVHVTLSGGFLLPKDLPEEREKCDHDWDNDGCNPEFCLKCGMSFIRYVHMECP